ncbi:MAG: hypothetical protein R3268_00860 [Acidiferrobacterales bacterium]|nr:hypothetical protein [Acidiferrobacterales bacterium]
MLRHVVLVAVLCALPTIAVAQDDAGGETKTASSGTKAKALSGSEAKELSGMSILGNDETAKALYIVPWKSSEIGLAADLRSGLLNDAMVPVDKEVFMRELQFYEITSHE